MYLLLFGLTTQWLRISVRSMSSSWRITEKVGGCRTNSRPAHLRSNGIVSHTKDWNQTSKNSRNLQKACIAASDRRRPPVKQKLSVAKEVNRPGWCSRLPDEKSKGVFDPKLPKRALGQAPPRNRPVFASPQTVYLPHLSHNPVRHSQAHSGSGKYVRSQGPQAPIGIEPQATFTPQVKNGAHAQTKGRSETSIKVGKKSGSLSEATEPLATQNGSCFERNYGHGPRSGINGNIRQYSPIAKQSIQNGRKHYDGDRTRSGDAGEEALEQKYDSIVTPIEATQSKQIMRSLSEDLNPHEEPLLRFKNYIHTLTAQITSVQRLEPCDETPEHIKRTETRINQLRGDPTQRPFPELDAVLDKYVDEWVASEHSN